MDSMSLAFAALVVLVVAVVVFLVTRAFFRRDKPGADVPREKVPRE